jgi:RNA polymerase sigma-70 factor, ECF subfamily
MTTSQLEQLYDRYAAALFRYLRRFARQEADVQDMLQELFMKLARSGSEPDGWHNEKAWMYGLARNLGIDWQRRRQSRSRAMEQLQQQPQAEHAPASDADAPALRSSLAQALTALPAEQREVLQLKLWDGLTFEEIASVLSIPLNTAASRYRYGLTHMQRELEPLYQEML